MPPSGPSTQACLVECVTGGVRSARRCGCVRPCGREGNASTLRGQSMAANGRIAARWRLASPGSGRASRVASRRLRLVVRGGSRRGSDRGGRGCGVSRGWQAAAEGAGGGPLVFRWQGAWGTAGRTAGNGNRGGRGGNRMAGGRGYAAVGGMARPGVMARWEPPGIERLTTWAIIGG